MRLLSEILGREQDPKELADFRKKFAALVESYLSKKKEIVIPQSANPHVFTSFKTLPGTNKPIIDGTDVTMYDEDARRTKALFTWPREASETTSD